MIAAYIGIVVLSLIGLFQVALFAYGLVHKFIYLRLIRRAVRKRLQRTLCLTIGQREALIDDWTWNY